MGWEATNVAAQASDARHGDTVHHDLANPVTSSTLDPVCGWLRAEKHQLGVELARSKQRQMAHMITRIGHLSFLGDPKNATVFRQTDKACPVR